MAGLMLGKYVDGAGKVHFVEVTVDANGHMLIAGAGPDAPASVLVTAGQITTKTATILINQSLSDAVDMGLMRLARIVMPAAWDAAKITFEVSHDGATYKPYYADDDTEYAINPPANVEREMTFGRWIGVRYVKVRSGTSAAAVLQTAARSIVLVLVP